MKYLSPGLSYFLACAEANLGAGCTVSSASTSSLSLANRSRMMSDYEVTLVNDNSKTLLTPPPQFSSFLRLRKGLTVWQCMLAFVFPSKSTASH